MYFRVDLIFLNYMKREKKKETERERETIG